MFYCIIVVVHRYIHTDRLVVIVQRADGQVVLVPVSAGQKISAEVTKLLNQSKRDGLASLSDKDWALLFILNKAQNVINNGQLEFHILGLRNKFIDGFKGEGIKPWISAFDEALDEACEHYIIPHPDSK